VWVIGGAAAAAPIELTGFCISLAFSTWRARCVLHKQSGCSAAVWPLLTAYGSCERA
jgi:hypothetical protein